jgi:hypothetical protein
MDMDSIWNARDLAAVMSGTTFLYTWKDLETA